MSKTIASNISVGERSVTMTAGVIRLDLLLATLPNVNLKSLTVRHLPHGGDRSVSVRTPSLASLQPPLLSPPHTLLLAQERMLFKKGVNTHRYTYRYTEVSIDSAQKHMHELL